MNSNEVYRLIPFDEIVQECLKHHLRKSSSDLENWWVKWKFSFSYSSNLQIANLFNTLYNCNHWQKVKKRNRMFYL